MEKEIDTTSCRVYRDYTGLYRPLCLKLLGCYKGIPKLSFHVIWSIGSRVWGFSCHNPGVYIHIHIHNGVSL